MTFFSQGFQDKYQSTKSIDAEAWSLDKERTENETAPISFEHDDLTITYILGSSGGLS